MQEALGKGALYFFFLFWEGMGGIWFSLLKMCQFQLEVYSFMTFFSIVSIDIHLSH